MSYLASRQQADQIETLGALAANYATKARADNTRLSYRKQWSYFVAWCATQGLAPMPAAPETVAMYLSDKAASGLKPSSLSLALAAISKAHEASGHPSPRSSSLVKEVFAGIRNTHGVAPSQKPPVLVDDLRTMLAGASVRDRALVLLGWTGALRRSELVSLNVGDVRFVPQGLVVTLRRSKTDQAGNGREVAIPSAADPELCAVAAVRSWLDQLEDTTGPLFVSVDRYGNQGGRLDGKEVARTVKRLGGDRFSGHSLRSGLVTAAARAGVSATDIATVTGHKSVAMVQRYIRAAEAFASSPAARLL